MNYPASSSFRIYKTDENTIIVHLPDYSFIKNITKRMIDLMIVEALKNPGNITKVYLKKGKLFNFIGVYDLDNNFIGDIDIHIKEYEKLDMFNRYYLYNSSNDLLKLRLKDE